MIGFFRSLANASSFTTFSDSVDCGEIDSSSTLHSRIALTISLLHIAATSIPAMSIHTDTPACCSPSTSFATRSRSFAA